MVSLVNDADAGVAGALAHVKIDKSAGVPIYVQLAEQIRLLTHEGVLRNGDPMPTVRTLAVWLGINANTVSRVYRDLQVDGVLRMERGVGTFVDGASQPMKQRDFKALEDKVLEVIRLGRDAGMTSAEVSQMIEIRWKESRDA